MRAHSFTTLGAAIGFVAALLLAAPAQGASEPDNVAAEVRGAAKECRVLGGKPNTQGMLRAVDLTGKGGPDWIVDYAKLDCKGIPHPFCGSAGCTLQVYQWSGGTKWVRVFDQNVRSYRIRPAGRRRSIQIFMGGSACGKVNVQSCEYVFQNSRLRRVR